MVEPEEMDEDIAAEMQMMKDLRRALRSREGFSPFDINRDGIVDIDDLRDSLLRFEWIIFSGVLLVVLPALNYLGLTSIHSDLFWSLAGLCLLIEGLISVYQIRTLRRRLK